MNEFDEKRAAAIDAANEARTLTPTPEYGWEATAARIKALEDQVDLWHKKYLAATGMVAHYKRELEGAEKPPNRAVQIAREVFEQVTSPSSLPCPEMARTQSVLKAWERKNFGETPLENLGLGVAEEAGELCHALLKRSQGIRGMQVDSKFLDGAGDAIADCAIYLMQLASSLRLDFATLIINTAHEVTKRNWTANPELGNAK